jgi:hypothetical protein
MIIINIRKCTCKLIDFPNITCDKGEGGGPSSKKYADTAGGPRQYANAIRGLRSVAVNNSAKGQSQSQKEWRYCTIYTLVLATISDK